jgi:hypothetical protein
MKTTKDGTIAYVDLRPGETLTIEPELAKLKAEGVEYVEVYELDETQRGVLGQRWLSTWRTCDGRRLRP